MPEAPILQTSESGRPVVAVRALPGASLKGAEADRVAGFGLNYRLGK
jgi:hypothetical protein